MDFGSTRKRQALELFRGLPRHYDLVATVLSFGQDPRWRRALVERGGATRRGSGARCRHRNGHGRRGTAAAQWLHGGGVSIRAPRCLPALALALRAAGARCSRGADRGAGREAALRGRELHGAHLHLPPALCRRSTRDDARAGPRGGSRRSCRLPGVRGPATATRADGLALLHGRRAPLLGRAVSREWSEVGRFLGPSIAGFYERHPLERIVEYWREAGLRGHRGPPDEPRRRHRDVGNPLRP